MTLQFQLAEMKVLSMVQTLLQILNGACLMTIIWGVREVISMVELNSREMVGEKNQGILGKLKNI